MSCEEGNIDIEVSKNLSFLHCMCMKHSNRMKNAMHSLHENMKKLDMQLW